jgi:redox-sensing transcriptional repressor
MRKSASTPRLAAEREATARHPRRAGSEVSEKVVARLALYRRILLRAADAEQSFIFSHEIAGICGATSAQVRRDLMAVGFVGHPIYGYEIAGLVAKLDSFLDRGRGVRMALVGVGNLGRALLSYFNAGKQQMTIVAAFDTDRTRVNRTIGGCHSHHLDELPQVLSETRVDVGVIAVPAAAAQQVADMLVAAGVRSLINLAPVRLQLPRNVFVEDVDLGIAIEKAAFYARSRRK